MKNIWSAVFSRAVVDSSTNSLSLFDCLDEIVVNFSKAEDISQAQKNIQINLSVVSLWSDQDTSKKREFDYLVELIDPQGKKINEFLNTPVFEEGKKRLRTIVQVNGMVATVEGEYQIIVKYKVGHGSFITASEIPLDIKFILSAPIIKDKK